MEIRQATEEHSTRVAAFVAARQADPRAHIAYLGTDPGGVAADLAALEPLGWAGVLVAWSGGEVAGVLGADWDSEPPRVWWQGPFVEARDWDEVADALLAAGLALLPATVTEQELAPDDRNTRVAAFARRHGFAPEEASVVLRAQAADVAGAPAASSAAERPRAAGVDGTGASGDVVGVAGLAGVADLADLEGADRLAVAALHDRLFPGTHRTGERLADGDGRFVLVALAGGRVVGYVAAERQSDGAGYVDFLGVDEGARGAGVGGALVRAACRVLADRHGCDAVALTVRESNGAARRLYARLGFTEERLLRPWRRGFAP